VPRWNSWVRHSVITLIYSKETTVGRLISAIDQVKASDSPALTKYLKAKREFPDFVVFIEVGDFCETFFEDAVLVSKELELLLLGKRDGDDRIAMAGVRTHAIERYVVLLADKGIKSYIKWK
jgi:DNA mismatch repair protein MutS